MAKPLVRSVCLCALHPLVLSELTGILERGTFRVVDCRCDLLAIARRQRLRIPRASLYVVDSPSKSEGAEHLVMEILDRFPHARILVVMEKLDEAAGQEFLGLGVRGLLCYSDIRDRLVEALETIARGAFWGPRTILYRFIDTVLRTRRRTVKRLPGSALSRRENEVLELLLENLSNKEIAVRLHVSLRTVKFHVSNLLAKYGVRGRTDLLLIRSA